MEKNRYLGAEISVSFLDGLFLHFTCDANLEFMNSFIIN